MEPAVWVVAGCLFEVSLPQIDGQRWRVVEGGPEVTLLAERSADGVDHFRFRAEAPGAVAGGADLEFRSDSPDPIGRRVRVQIVPESWPG